MNWFIDTSLCVRTNLVVEEINENEFDLYSRSLSLILLSVFLLLFSVVTRSYPYTTTQPWTHFFRRFWIDKISEIGRT